MAKLNPKDILKNGVITATHQDHQNRTPPSAGIDIDDPALKEGSKARVNSPIDGEVTGIGPGYNTVIIKDKDDNTHKLLHHSSVSVKAGDKVKKGDKIGELGSKVPGGSAAIKDHVHYQIQDKDGNFLDPEKFDYPDEA